MSEAKRTPRPRPIQQDSPGSTDTGRFAPLLPVDGRELIAAWRLPSEAYDTETVKIARCIIGTHRIELLDSMPLRDFSMGATAREYGPGKYRVSPGPGPYSDKSTTLEISDEYARRAGWATAPPMIQTPTAVETMAARTFQMAQSGPVDPINLAAMIEVAVSRAMIQQTQATPPANPLDLMLKGFELSNMMQSKSMEAAKALLGVAGPAEQTARTFADVLIELGPQILDTLKTVAPMVAGAIASNTQPIHAPMTRVVNQQEPPAMSREQAPQHTAVNLPALTPDEVQATAPIISVLKPYAGMMATRLASAPPEELADQMLGAIGPDLYPSVVALDAAVKKYGLPMFAHIGPNLGTASAAIVVHNMAQAIMQEDPE